MSTAIIFNKEIEKQLQANDNMEITKFIRNKFLESKRETYNGFFDDFLFSYGIISFGYTPLLDYVDKYVPYLNCTDNNIFRMKKGCTDLSAKAHSISDCEKLMAQYLIEKLKNVDLKIIKEWNS